MNQTFTQRVLLCAFLYYVVFLALGGVIYLLSHVPPSTVNLDGLILRLGDVEEFLAWPRWLFLKLWPGESTHVTLNYLLLFLNCLVWGLLLAGLKTLWTNSRK